MAQVFIIKRQILCIIPINFTLQPIDRRAKYSVDDPDPYSEYGSGRVDRIRIRTDPDPDPQHWQNLYIQLEVQFSKLWPKNFLFGIIFTRIQIWIQNWIQNWNWIRIQHPTLDPDP